MSGLWISPGMCSERWEKRATWFTLCSAFMRGPTFPGGETQSRSAQDKEPKILSWGLTRGKKYFVHWLNVRGDSVAICKRSSAAAEFSLCAEQGATSNEQGREKRNPASAIVAKRPLHSLSPHGSKYFFPSRHVRHIGEKETREKKTRWAFVAWSPGVPPPDPTKPAQTLTGYCKS